MSSRCHVRDRERGFSILEMSIASAIVLLASLAVLTGTTSLARSLQSLQDRQRGEGTIAQQVQRWKSDASSALAISLTADPSCTLGQQVTGTQQQHLTIDFYGKSNATDMTPGSGVYNGVWTEYDYDGAQLTRTVYTVTNGNPTRLSQTSMPIESLTAQCFQPSALTDPELHGAAVPNVAVKQPVALPGRPAPQASNYIIEITARTKLTARTVRLTSGTATTGLTISGPQWHTIVWREQHTRRFLFGFGQHTWIRVMVRVIVSWDEWQTESTWCEWEPFQFDGQTNTGLIFDKIDVPFIDSRVHPKKLSPPLDDLLPDHLMQYCAHHPEISTTHTNDPPGPGAPPSGPGTTTPDPPLSLPSYFVWQHCHTGATWSYAQTACVGVVNPSDFVTCDPNVPWNCTVNVPATPPEGWPAWCAAYSGTTWSATNPPYYAGPDSRCPRPPGSPPAPSPRPTHCGIKNPIGTGPRPLEAYVDPDPGDPTVCCPHGTYDDGTGTCVANDPSPSPATPTPAPTVAPSFPPVSPSGSWLQDCRMQQGDPNAPGDQWSAPGDPTQYPSNGWTDPKSGNQVWLTGTGTDYLYVLEPVGSAITDGNGNTVYNTGYACVQRTS